MPLQKICPQESTAADSWGPFWCLVEKFIKKPCDQGDGADHQENSEHPLYQHGQGFNKSVWIGHLLHLLKHPSG